MPRHYARRVQRAFSTFPFGLTGFALAAFRVCVASQALLRIWPVTSHSGSTTVIAVILAMGLLLGIATPFVAAFLALARLTEAIAFERSWGADSMFEIAYALVLAGLGPGAYSLDAVLFGRRRIELPSDDALKGVSESDESTPSH